MSCNLSPYIALNKQLQSHQRYTSHTPFKSAPCLNEMLPFDPHMVFIALNAKAA
jgi:hypothetical protein